MTTPETKNLIHAIHNNTKAGASAETLEAFNTATAATVLEIAAEC